MEPESQESTAKQCKAINKARQDRQQSPSTFQAAANQSWTVSRLLTLLATQPAHRAGSETPQHPIPSHPQVQARLVPVRDSWQGRTKQNRTLISISLVPAETPTQRSESLLLLLRVTPPSCSAMQGRPSRAANTSRDQVCESQGPLEFFSSVPVARSPPDVEAPPLSFATGFQRSSAEATCAVTQGDAVPHDQRCTLTPR